MNITKLVIKELIDSSLSEGRMLDDDHVPLQQFFVVLEHILRHGLKRELALQSLLHQFIKKVVQICEEILCLVALYWVI